jgi:diguanylate cyclase
MQDKDKKPDSQSPADIARETLLRLAARRIAPTPDAYRETYEEIAGGRTLAGAEKVLADFVASLTNASEEVAQLAAQFDRALEERDWAEYSKNLSHLVERHLKQDAVQAKAAAPARTQLIPLVDDPKPATRISLVDDVPAPSAPPPAPIPVVGEGRKVQMLRELLIRTLSLALGSLLRNAPALAEESEVLARAIQTANTEPALNDISGRLKQLCFKIELKAEDLQEEHELLLRLFQLLLENISELLDDDSWLSGQIASVRDLLAGPLSHAALLDATRSLKEVIYKQSMLKHSLKEAKVTVKNMMVNFIDRLGAAAASTGNYHRKMNDYVQQIGQAKGIIELNKILEDVMRDTKATQDETLRSRDEMMAARQEVQEAEARIVELESKLEQMSELVREDQLTGSLNRRGLEDVFDREMARSARRSAPLCIAMLDLDDFKRLNDTYGHAAGDQALIHVVRVIKDTLRSMDVIARFGGEEFMIVLPETPLDEAIHTVTRVQRELTKRIFMHDNQRLLLTFSAGVAMRAPNEDQQALIKRADDALYKAKKAGKNRVVAADAAPLPN